MLTTIESFDLSMILSPVQRPERAETDAWAFMPSLYVKAGNGVAVGNGTNSGKGTLYDASTNTTGTGGLKGLSKYTFTTDANGLIYFGTPGGSSAASASLTDGPHMTAPVFIRGIFDPTDTSLGGATTRLTIADLLTGKPGACVLQNGFFDIP